MSFWPLVGSTGSELEIGRAVQQSLLLSVDRSVFIPLGRMLSENSSLWLSQPERSLEPYAEVQRVSYRSPFLRTGAMLWVTPQERGHHPERAMTLYPSVFQSAFLCKR